MLFVNLAALIEFFRIKVKISHESFISKKRQDDREIYRSGEGQVLLLCSGPIEKFTN